MLPSSSAFHHVLHVRPVFEVLVEFADVAADVFVGAEAERNDWDEAKREPFPAFVDARAEVAAVLALGGDVFVALKYGGECCGAWLACECCDAIGFDVLWVPQVKMKAMVAVLSQRSDVMR